MTAHLSNVDVSIIIVNWNTKQLLLDCIASLFHQTKTTAIEVIVVDNGSTDKSSEEVRKMFPDVAVIENNVNLGFARANNIGISASSGKYICLVNSDIKILDGCVDRMFTHMELNPAVAVLGPKTVNEDLTIRLDCRELPTLWTSFCEAFALNRLLPGVKLFKGRILTNLSQHTSTSVGTLPGCMMMVRRTAMIKVGTLDERFYFYGEDRDWCRRFHDTGWDVVFYPEATVIHYGGASSSTDPLRFLIELLKSDLAYWQKYSGVFVRTMHRLIGMVHHGIRAGAYFLLAAIGRNANKTAIVQARNHTACLYWIVIGRLPRSIYST